MKWLFLSVGFVTVAVTGYLAYSNNVFALTSFVQDQDKVRPGENAGQELDKTRFEDPEYWRGRLTKEQFEVTREKGTEPPFKNEFYDNKRKGNYRCVCCGELLFDSSTKFDSGTGWPSFYAPTEGGAVAESEDTSHNMVRTEVTCAKCDAHLGHVFPYRTQPTGLRYCINSASLTFEELDKDGNPVKKNSDENTDDSSDNQADKTPESNSGDSKSTNSDSKMIGEDKKKN